MTETRVVYAHPETGRAAFDVDVFGTFGTDTSVPVEAVPGFDPAWTPVAVVEFRGALARRRGDVALGSSGRIYSPAEIVTSVTEDGEPFDLPPTIRVLWSGLAPHLGPGEVLDHIIAAALAALMEAPTVTGAGARIPPFKIAAEAK